MARYTLTISPDYVKDWSAKDAIRELIQNAIDQESLDENNNKDIYSIDNDLVIANKNSILEKSTLLLGGGTKDGSSTIGQFGEGYKVALLVLLREGYDVEIRNYKAEELWIPKIVNSRVYNSKVLAIDTMEYKYDTIPDNSLEIVIRNIDSNDILKDIWLDYNNNVYSSIKSHNAEILLDESQKGNIYIKGLKVSNLGKLEYGYNFDVNVLKLGRDRNVVSGFDLQLELGSVWGRIPEEYKQLTLDLMKKKVYDVEYCKSYRMNNYVIEAIENEYKDKVVISDESDKQAIKDTLGDVQTEVVHEGIKDIVWCNQRSKNNVYIKRKSNKELVQEFRDRWVDIMEEDMLEDLENLIKNF